MAKLTPLAIRNMQPSTVRKEYPDGGAANLYVVVQPSGVKTFAVRCRVSGRPAKITLGKFVFEDSTKGKTKPKVGGPLTLLAARRLALDMMDEVGQGSDPRESKRTAKEERRAAEANTFRAVAEEYLKRVCGMRVDAEGNVTFDHSKKRTGRERHLMLKRLVFPVIGDRPIAEIRRREIVHLLDRIEDRNGPVVPDRVLALLSVIMTWHAKRDDSFATPLVKGMTRTKPGERARDRRLADHEIRVVWKVAENQGTFGRLVRFILLTAARRTEAAGMVWAELDGSDWTLPATRNKTKADLLRPLTAAAIAALPEKTGNHVFSNNGKTQISGYSKFKKRFDEAVLAELRQQDPTAAPLKNWVLHDLRRTARSLMSRADVNVDHAERCLGHVIGGVRGVYDRHSFYDEKKRAFEALAAQIAAIVDPQSQGKVVALTRSKPT